ncbi:SDR family NAD(P)-dependent oxidoreductase [Comamonas sp. 26]|uniref:SDR family NAD(P)-dependent oxidoreductase n=1 Tax=Comamonas sp. 26 TaxID=2035201 RepID=UPI000C182D4F|nr:SDR family NAD(P)-dependent oxidoreductase [Comamonas sp. 26]PIG08494.1 NAD(P)-dependent dehydrogenase (short-subunit alcohol dehydrogenase family) [Comamonas sp. 26]
MNELLSGLKGKVILITGGASGIGLAAAEVAAASGAHVICADVAQSQALPSGCEFQALDVTDWGMTQALVEKVLAQHGAIDGLVTSAGISRVGNLQEMTLQEWEQVLQVNLTGTMLSARAVAAYMKQRKQGSIVAVASINGILGNPSNLAYCTSKGAVIQMVRSLAADLGPHGVRINAISPGLIHTPMTAGLDQSPAYNGFVKQHLLHRAGQAHEVGNAVAFLLSDMASFITGTNIPVDGGFSAAKVIEMY